MADTPTAAERAAALVREEPGRDGDGSAMLYVAGYLVEHSHESAVLAMRVAIETAIKTALAEHEHATIERCADTLARRAQFAREAAARFKEPGVIDETLAEADGLDRAEAALRALARPDHG